MKNATDITVILDHSFSMHSVRSEMEEVLNGWVAQQKLVPGECTFTLVSFDDIIEYPEGFQGVPLSAVGPIYLVPRGNTALLDAIGETIDRTGKRLAAMDEKDRPNKVMIVTVTDGAENQSKKYKNSDPAKGPIAAKVNEMVIHQRDVYKWDFVFLGADQDAITTAAGMGFTTALNYTNTPGGVRGMGSRLNKMSSSYRSSESAEESTMQLCSISSAGGNSVNAADTEEWNKSQQKG